MVCNLHFPTDFEIYNFAIEHEKGISEEQTLPVSWQDEKLFLKLPRPGREPMTSCTHKLHYYKQGVSHTPRSAMGRWYYTVMPPNN